MARVSLITLLLVSGCASSRYSISSPVERNLDDKGATVSMLPMVYELTPVQGLLVVLVRNVSGEKVTISAEAITADGKSHPLRGGTVGPAEALKLILPPTVSPPGGARSDDTYYATNERPGRFGERIAPPLDDPANAWQWDGPLELRVTMTGGEETIEQTLMLRRNRQ